MNSWKITLFIFPIFLFHSLNAQIQLKDAETNQAIPFVEVYSESGAFLGVCDESGVLYVEVIKKVKDSPTIQEVIFKHISYEKKRIGRDMFFNLSSIYLTPRVRVLDELIIKPKGKKSVILLSGYYRSYQTKESKLEYFTEGTVEIIYEKGSEKSLNKRIEERTWQDIHSKPQSNIIINMTGPPIPTITYFVEENQKSKPEATFKIKLAENINQLSVEIPKISPSNPKTIQLLGNESIIGYDNEVYAFQTNKVENLLPQYLSYFKKIKELKFKCKSCSEYLNYHLEAELFITRVTFLDTKPNGFSKFTGFKENSHYERAFWKDFETHPFFEPLPKFIKDCLEKSNH